MRELAKRIGALLKIIAPWSFFAIYRYFHNQNISFTEQGAWNKVALLFNGLALQGAPLCACCFVPVFQFHALKRHRPIDKKYNFFSCT